MWRLSRNTGCGLPLPCRYWISVQLCIAGCQGRIFCNWQWRLWAYNDPIIHGRFFRTSPCQMFGGLLSSSSIMLILNLVRFITSYLHKKLKNIDLSIHLPSHSYLCTSSSLINIPLFSYISGILYVSTSHTCRNTYCFSIESWVSTEYKANGQNSFLSCSKHDRNVNKFFYRKKYLQNTIRWGYCPLDKENFVCRYLVRWGVPLNRGLSCLSTAFWSSFRWSLTLYCYRKQNRQNKYVHLTRAQGNN